MGAANTRKNRKNMNGKKMNGANASDERPLSIEAPRRSKGQPAPEQPRQPKDLQGLLRFAMEASDRPGGAANARPLPLDEEKKTFLNEALKSMTVNVIEELQKSIKVLGKVADLQPDQDPREFEDALDQIADFVDNMDIANDFYKIGGFSIFGECLNSRHSRVRSKAANIIAELTQNNPFCQERILEMGVLPILLGMVDSDESEQTRIKALYAVSCIIRGHPSGLRVLDEQNGYGPLFRALQSPIEKLQVKSAFLLCALCNREDVASVGGKLVKMGLIEQAAGLLTKPNLSPDTREQLLGILVGLTNNNYLPALQECHRPELCLKLTLLNLHSRTSAEGSRDEAENCKILLDRVFFEQGSEKER